MTPHPALQPGRTAVITGAAGGIGLATARRCAALGMNVLMADSAADALREAEPEVAAAGGGKVQAVACDVADPEALRHLKETAWESFGGTAFLMNNAIERHPGGCWDSPEAWRRTLEVGLFGVINGCQAFTQAMIDQGTPAVIVNVGSKQGITNPPGRPHYNVAKAGVKAYTELLQHQLRNTAECQVTAHLLIPGLTTTAGRPHKPEAWWPDQVVDEMMAGLAAGDFYILCPDNETPRALDRKRMLWAAGDVADNRPALSRWHPDFKAAFAAFEP